MKTSNRLSAFVFALLAAAGLAAMTGCEDQGPAEEAGEEVDEAMEETGDAIEDAGEEMEDAAD